MRYCPSCGENYLCGDDFHKSSPPTPEQEARLIIEHLTRAALELAITREGLEWDKDEEKSIEDMVRSTVNAMTGDDAGCLEELNAENTPLIWLTERIRRVR